MIVSKIDWSYHRPGCKTCQKTQDFLQSHDIATAEQVDAKKQTLQLSDALALAEKADQIISAKGSKVVRFDLRKEKPGVEALKAAMIGPTGNLRAPTFRVGRTVVVGFHEEVYREVFLKS